MTLTVRAPAKVNLRLEVGPPRPDGYHPLHTVYEAIGLYDDVTVTEAAQWEVAVTPTGRVDVSGVPLDEQNIAIRAGRLLARHHGIDRAARVHITKGIPVAGGMAGGSADAAATLVALDRLWNAGTTDAALLALAAELGSDVPFALVGGVAEGTGRGELVQPWRTTGTHWWVVLPAVSDGLSTPAVYREHDRLAGAGTPGGVAELLAGLAAGDLDPRLLGNDLQPAALSLRPALATVLDEASAAGARTALVSGSGPTVLGLCDDHGHAHTVREALLAAGHRDVLAVPGPVSGAHVVEYS